MTSVLTHSDPVRAKGGRRQRRTLGTRIGRGLAWLLLVALAASMVLPLAFIVNSSLRPERDYQTDELHLATSPTFRNYINVWSSAHFATYGMNSLLVTLMSLVVVVVLSTLSGYALTHLWVPARGTMRLIVISFLVLPAALFMVPTFKAVLDLGLLDHYVGLALVYVSLQLPFGTFMMSSYFTSVPRELLESAAVDGASPVRTFVSVAVPLAKPAIKTLAVLSFLSFWNELLFALLILPSDGHHTLTVGLAYLRYSAVFAAAHPQDTVLAAGLTLAALPPFLLFILMNRTLASGLTAGALKS